MKALSIHAPYIYDIVRGVKKEEYRTWTPNSLGEDEDLLLCSSAKKYAGYVSGYALAVCRIGDLIAYYDDFDNLVEYGWQIKRLRFIKPFPVKGKLHFFEVDDSSIEVLKGISFSSWKKAYYEPLIYTPRRRK